MICAIFSPIFAGYINIMFSENKETRNMFFRFDTVDRVAPLERRFQSPQSVSIKLRYANVKKRKNSGRVNGLAGCLTSVRLQVQGRQPSPTGWRCSRTQGSWTLRLGHLLVLMDCGLASSTAVKHSDHIILWFSFNILLNMFFSLLKVLVTESTTFCSKLYEADVLAIHHVSTSAIVYGLQIIRSNNWMNKLQFWRWIAHLGLFEQILRSPNRTVKNGWESHS